MGRAAGPTFLDTVLFEHSYHPCGELHSLVGVYAGVAGGAGGGISAILMKTTLLKSQYFLCCMLYEEEEYLFKLI